ncbi:hypothetical protein [Streptomyces sp. NPDC048057]|uniref:hypothetical protein n=1 Tax=Streptomyces sp. NPDC048057 TaxID=3155628 RepID=UPI0033F5AC7C
MRLGLYVNLFSGKDDRPALADAVEQAGSPSGRASTGWCSASATCTAPATTRP